MKSPWFPIAGLCVVAAGLGYVIAGPLVEPAPSARGPVEMPEAESTGIQRRPPTRSGVRPRSVRPARQVAPPTARLAPPTARLAPPAAEPTPPGPLESLPQRLKRTQPEFGRFVTADAMNEPDMSALGPKDERYDAVIDAQQRFHAFEQDILAGGALSRERWTALSEKHDPQRQELLKRSVQFAHDGFGQESEALVLEWALLEAGYAGQIE